MTENEINELWKNPKSWRAVLIYYCKDDPRVIVPKRLKFTGWTLNFANPWAVPTLILMILCVLAPFVILRRLDLPRNSNLWPITVISVLVVLILFCFIMASPKLYSKK